MPDPATQIVDHSIETNETTPEPRPDIPDPPPSRRELCVRAHIWRNLAQLGFGLQNIYNWAPSPSRTTWIDSTISKRHKKPKAIRLDIYDPRKRTKGEGRLPVVVSFHGGGFTLGQGTDDALWAKHCNEKLGAVVVSVSYRLAPQYPFPTAVEDAADAILWVSQHASDLQVDAERLLLSGFSSGGNLVFSAFNILHYGSTWQYDIPTPPPIIGIIAFYPLLDYSVPRWLKRSQCARPDLTLGANLTELTDSSYLFPNPEQIRRDPRLSPACASDDMLRGLPPVHLCLCENDMLLQEGREFAKRLESLENIVTIRVVEGEKHAFDKPPPLPFKPKAVLEYTKATASAERWLRKSDTT